jgi:hypothetical protein
MKKEQPYGCPILINALNTKVRVRDDIVDLNVMMYPNCINYEASVKLRQAAKGNSGCIIR